MLPTYEYNNPKPRLAPKQLHSLAARIVEEGFTCDIYKSSKTLPGRTHGNGCARPHSIMFNSLGMKARFYSQSSSTRVSQAFDVPHCRPVHSKDCTSRFVLLGAEIGNAVAWEPPAARSAPFNTEQSISTWPAVTFDCIRAMALRPLSTICRFYFYRYSRTISSPSGQQQPRMGKTQPITKFISVPGFLSTDTSQDASHENCYLWTS